MTTQNREPGSALRNEYNKYLESYNSKQSLANKQIVRFRLNYDDVLQPVVRVPRSTARGSTPC